jgi:hypothetical protein
MDSGEHDAAEELAFRRRFFPGSQSLRRNRQLLDIQASPKYRKLLDIQGSLDFFGLEASRKYEASVAPGAAGSARSGGVAGSKGGVGGARGCERYRERWWVESERGWPPALVDRLEAFLARKAP